MRRALVWGGQLVLGLALVWFVARSVVDNWARLGGLNLEYRIRPGLILLSGLMVWLTFGLLIEAWRRVILGWGQDLRYGPAARIWCLANLGRYLPGKLWSVAALAVLAQRAGVVAWTATASALVMQVLALGTGAVWVAVGAPSAASPWVLTAAVVTAAGAILVLAWEPAVMLASQWVRSISAIEALPLRTSVIAATSMLLAWFAYGIAFWLLAEGLFEDPGLSLLRAVGVFAAGYIVGLLALFAPGGVGVRELVLVALLGGVMGSGSALALSVASRLLMTGAEISAVLAALWLSRRNKEEPLEHSA